MTARAAIQKISARVFCQYQGTGGNPVTVFVGSNLMDTAERLAQQCTWESVMVDPETQQMAFYMPTGQAVSFCAHAAMGGAFCLAQEAVSSASESTIDHNKDNNNNQQQQQQQQVVNFTAAPHPDDDNNNDNKTFRAQVDVPDQIVSLSMTARFQANKPSNPTLLQRVLRESLQVPVAHVIPGTSWQASIARTKTLVGLDSVDAVHAAVAPSNPSHFERCCDALDGTTGVYLFARDDVTTTWECRQFPRASGYPEDPATGIAAAALAASFQRVHGSTDGQFRFHQGTAMGQPSLILVDRLEWGASGGTSPNDNSSSEQQYDAPVSFDLTGHIQIDEQSTIER